MKGKTLRIIVSLTTFLSVSSMLAQEKMDWAMTNVYSQANKEIKNSPRAVLLGDSITDVWLRVHPDFFTDNNLVGRGISGQTTSQILVRMREDVVKLHPKYVVILCGLNDIALNPGYAGDVEKAVGSIISMCEIAQANGIKPIVCSLLGSYEIRWRPEVTDCFDQVLRFNDLLRTYAGKNRIKYVDYFNLLSDGTGRIGSKWADDTVHPNQDGYKMMEDYLLTFLR